MRAPTFLGSVNDKGVGGDGAASSVIVSGSKAGVSRFTSREFFGFDCVRYVGQGRSPLWRPLGDGRSGRAISKGHEPVDAIDRHPRTSATGTRTPQHRWRGVKCSTVPEIGRAYARHKSCGSSWAPPRELVRVPPRQARTLADRRTRSGAALRRDLLRLSRQRNDFAGLVLGLSSNGTIQMFAGKFEGA
jgi:hypothetical protein